MRLEKIRVKLKIILKNLNEWRAFGEVRAPKPDYEKLFSDFSKIAAELKEINPELYDDINIGVNFITKSKSGFQGNSYTVYNGSQLELLFMEVEKALNYIKISDNDKNTVSRSPNAIATLNLISDRFHLVTKQIRKRHNDAPTIDVKDEYDVQDLYHAILKLFFDDVRPESYVPEYAGRNSRIDFILKAENVAIEIKKSRKTLKAKELGEQLIIDIERYKDYPDIDALYCFVYDPDGWIDNPKGIENDLSGIRDRLNILVKIEPK